MYSKSNMSLDQKAIKRILLRLKQNCDEFNERELVNKFLVRAGLQTEDFPHHVHRQSRESRHFYIILDINVSQVQDPNLEEVPHEVYEVKFHDGEP